MRTISIKELVDRGFDTWIVKDGHGISTKYTREVKVGDKVVLGNYFTLVTE